MKIVSINTIAMVAALYVTVCAQSALGCVCTPPVKGEAIEVTAERDFGRASAVVVAKVVGFEFRRGIASSELMLNDPLLVDPTKFETKMVTFEIERIWKGKASKMVFATEYLRTDTGDTIGSSCNFDFEVGSRYLVFATESRGVLRTRECSGTRKLTGSLEEKAILTHFGSFCLPGDPDGD